MTLTAGTRLGVYEILQPLGAGGMGQVYKARDTRLNRTVALKVLGDSTTDAKSARYILQEARAAAALDHPNICAVYEVGEHDGCGFIVMPYVEGETLAARLRRGPLDLAAVLEIGIQAADALADAHAHGVVHRDVKPQNIMVTPKGQVKVLDFGLAKLDPSHQSGDTHTMTALSRPGSVAGTLAYMSPEQARGEAADARSDAFSFGAVLDEMLGGQTRPPELTRIIGKCLERDRDRRYQSLHEVVTDLDSLRRQLKTGGSIPSSDRRRTGARIWLPVAAIVVAAVVATSFWRSGGSAPGEAIRTLAILPLRPLAGGVTENHIGLGIANSVITKVSARGLAVRPTSAVYRYAMEDASSLDVARRLDVDAVLEGGWQRDGDRLRVTVHLLRASDGRTIWADTFNMDWSDVFTIEDRLSQELADRLHLTIDQPTQARIAKRQTSNPTAYEYFTKGMYFFGDRDTGTSAVRSIEMFEQAVKADPKYALAHAQLGYALAWRSIRIDGDPRWIGRAKEEVRLAETLDAGLPEIPLVRSFIAWSQFEGWQVDEAIHQIYLAQRLDPLAGHNELAEVYWHIGLEEPAERAHERAIEIDPTSDAFKASFINEYYLSARPDQARAAEKRFQTTGALPALVYFLEKRLPQELRPLVEANLAKNPEGANARAQEALLLALEGRHQEARDRVPAIVKRAVKNRSYHHLTYNIARIYAAGGAVEPALTWLRETAAEGFPQYQLFQRDPYLDPIRNDPQFRTWLDGIRQKWEQYRRDLVPR